MSFPCPAHQKPDSYTDGPNRHFQSKQFRTFRLPSSQVPPSDSADVGDFPWKQAALPIMETYAESTDGSFIEVKDSALVWHYRDADPDFGSWQVSTAS